MKDIKIAESIVRRRHEKGITQEDPAACMEAFIQLTLGNATAVFDLLGEEINCLMSPETLIIGAYKLQGNVEKARELSQVNIYLNLASIIDNLSAYLLLYQEDPDRGEDIIRRGCGLIDLFDLSKISPNSCAIFYYHAAATNINRSEKENAYLMLERYVSVCSEQLTHLSFHDDTFFDLLQGWADKGHLFDNLPRNQKVINEGILTALSQTPAFSQLGNEKRFKQLYRRLEQSLNKGVDDMLTIQHLTKTYKKGKNAVDDLSLTVEAGDIYGFIGDIYLVPGELRRQNMKELAKKEV